MMMSAEEQMEIDPGGGNDDDDEVETQYDSDETMFDDSSDEENEQVGPALQDLNRPGRALHVLGHDPPVAERRGQTDRPLHGSINPNVEQAGEDSDATQIDSDDSLFGDDDDTNQPDRVPENNDQSEMPTQRTLRPETARPEHSENSALGNSQSQSQPLIVDAQQQNDQSGARTEPHDQSLPPAVVRTESQPTPGAPGQSSRDRRDPVAPADANQDEPRQPVVNVHADLSLINTSIQSPNNFVIPKKSIPFSPEKDDEAENCSICFDSWTNSGSHRLSSLKCGHLFGQSCIEKWLKGHGGKCPQCNAKAKKSDIRVLYAKAVRALDTTERDRALKELEKEKEIRRKAEVEAAQLKMQYQLALEECNRLKSQLRSHDRQISMQNRPGPSSSQAPASGVNGQYRIEKTITISPNGGCRVMAFDPSHELLVVSMPSPNNQLFPGYGIKKISMLDMKSSQYVTVHTKILRDCCFNNRQDGLLLSTSIDKTVKITSLLSNTVVQTYTCTVPVWSCAWNLDDTNYIYAGLMNGSIVMYDTRNTNTEVTQFNRDGSRCPIVSLHYVESNANSSFGCSGLLSGTLEGGQFWEKKTAAEYKPHILPLEGSCTYLSFERSTRHCLASFRPGRTHNTARHVMCELQCRQLNIGQSNTATCTCNPVQTFYGGSSVKHLTRSRLFQSPADQSKVLACAGDESSLSAQIWDGSTGSLRQKLPTNAPVMDVCPFKLNNQHLLATMTEKIVKIHKWS